MASSKIRIKRTSTSAITTGTLAIGELGYSSLAGTQSNTGDRLYIGIGAADATTTPVLLGGKYFTDMMSHVPGTLTASSTILVDANSKIDAINIGNITITGSTSVISSTNTDGNIKLKPNGAGYVIIEGTNALVLPSGTTAQQSPALAGAVRYNSERSTFEGYTGTSGSGNWASLGGVRSVDGLTYIIAESAPGESDDILHFYASNGTSAVEVSKLDTTGLKLLQSTANAGNATSGALQVAGGAGIGGNLWIGGALTTTGVSTFTDTATFNNGVTISGNTTAASEYFRITDSSATKFLVDTTSGNTTISGTLSAGNTTLSTLSATTGSFSGDVAVATNKFTIAAATGNTVIAGTLGVTGSTTVSSLNATGDLSVATNKFTVASATGNTAVAGTLSVTGQADVTGNFNVNTNKFQVVASSGNTTIAGTLNAGNSTLGTLSASTGSFSGNLSVATDKFTVASATGNTAVAGTLSVTGATTFGDTVAMGGYKITGLADPVVAQDAATKNYVDTLAQGLRIRDTVDFVTSTDVGAASYTPGAGTAPNLGDVGPGSYLTFATTPQFTYSWDGGSEVATFTNHSQCRVLVIGQTDAKQNGVYVWATATTFVRAIDADSSYAVNSLSATLSTLTAVVTLTSGNTSALSEGMPVFKVGGTGILGSNARILSINSATQITLTVNHATAGAINIAAGYGNFGGGDYFYVSDSGYGYVQTTEGVIFGSSNVKFTQFAGQGSWQAGAGLSLTGNTFSVNTANGITISGGNVQLASSVAGNGLSYASGVLTVGGTANRITSSGTSIDIASTYVGQTSITTLGTVGTGTWNGTAIGATYGGTGITSYAAGDILYASATNTLSKLAKATDGQVLMLSGGLPTWSDIDGGTF
jgi:hypothetical protein